MPSREQVAEVVAEYVYEAYRLGCSSQPKYLPMWHEQESRDRLPGVEIANAADALMPLFDEARNEALEEAAASVDEQQVNVWAGASRHIRALKTGGGGSSG
jgi:hypothetical protein